MQVPPQIRYTNITPKGFTSQYKQWPVDPMSSNQYWTPNDVIRIMLQLTQGLMDPFRSSIRIDVAVDTTINPMGGMQVDNSAQSFINQLVVTSKGTQIQRIAQYDTLAAYLTDVGFSQTVAQGRDQQGLGMSMIGTASNIPVNAKMGVQSTFTNGVGFQQAQLISALGTKTMTPTKMLVGGTLYSAQPPTQFGLDYTPNRTNGMNGNLFSFNNTWGSGTAPTAWTGNSYSTLGHYGSVRAQYNMKMSTPTYPQTPNSSLRCPLKLQPGSATSAPNSNPYNVVNSSTVQYQLFGNPLQNVSNTCDLQGYEVPYSPFYSKGCNQPMISATIPQAYMANGNIIPVGLPVQVKRFYLPLLSAVLGVLIPPQSYQLIPMKILFNTLLQFTLNPYAMFTSGYQDRNQFDVNGMQVQQPRNYRIIRFQYILNLYYFAQQAIKQYLQQSMSRGIVISSQGWILGSQYQIPNSQMVRNSWQVNSTCESLNQVVALFITNDHLKYTFCRKQFRLSHNITSMQLKFDVNYYPPQPIQGNSGNPQIIDNTLDNSQFYMQLLKSNNFLFNINQQLPRINRWNFAVNNRSYDPTNQRTMIDVNALANPNTYVWTPQSVNTDTAMGHSVFHQNRYVGRAAFVYSFQPFAHSKEFISGLDSRKARPFQIMFNTASTGYFTRDSTMLIFLRHNVIVMYGLDGIQALGR